MQPAARGAEEEEDVDERDGPQVRLRLSDLVQKCRGLNSARNALVVDVRFCDSRYRRREVLGEMLPHLLAVIEPRVAAGSYEISVSQKPDRVRSTAV